MNKIFASHLRKFVLVFFDDILVFSKSVAEHVTQLKQVLHNCVFVVPQVEYLGHVITAKGVSTDSSKTEAIKNYPTSKTVAQLRSFLGPYSIL
jgi:hypothetical protein